MRKLLWCASFLVAGCISVHPKIELPPRRGSVPPPVTATAEPALADERLNAVLWMQTAAEYRASAIQAFNTAQRMLGRALADPTWTAAEEQTGEFSSLPPAVILDIDETVLDNSPFEARQIRAGESYSEEKWQQWVEEASAIPIPGAATFTREAAARGVTVFYISGRQGTQENATRANLARHGFPLDPAVDTVLLKGEQADWGSDKSTRRRVVTSRYRVLLLIGDDFGDFTSSSRGSVEERSAAVDRASDRWGVRWIILPNAVYGSWERAVTGTEPDLTAHQKLQRKRDRLNTGR